MTVNPFVGYERWSPIWQVQVLPSAAHLLQLQVP